MPEAHFAAELADFQSEADQNILSRFESPEAAYRAVIDAKQLESKPFRLPADMSNLSDDQRAEFDTGMRTLRGVPDSVDGYKFETKDVPNLDDKLLGAFADMCHKTGRNQEEANGMFTWWNEMQAVNQKAIDATSEQTLTEHNEKAEKARAELWKGDQEANEELINRAITNVCDGDDEVAAATKDFTDFDVMHSLPMAKVMLALAKKAEGEGTVIPGEIPGPSKPTKNTWQSEFPNSGDGPESMEVKAPAPQAAN